MNFERNLSPLILAPIAAIVAAVGLPASAEAYSTADDLDAEDFDELQSDVRASVEGRIGSAAVEGDNTFELDIHETDRSGEFRNLDRADFAWENGEPTDFTVDYDSGTGLLSYGVGSKQLSASVRDRTFSDLYVRAGASEEDNVATVTNLSFKDSSVSEFQDLPASASSACNKAADCDFENTAEYVRIADVAGDFSLKGTSQFDWSKEDVPEQSEIAYQIKLAESGGTDDPTGVPEPSSAAALAIAGAALAGMKRRR